MQVVPAADPSEHDQPAEDPELLKLVWAGTVSVTSLDGAELVFPSFDTTRL